MPAKTGSARKQKPNISKPGAPPVQGASVAIDQFPRATVERNRENTAGGFGVNATMMPTAERAGQPHDGLLTFPFSNIFLIAGFGLFSVKGGHLATFTAHRSNGRVAGAPTIMQKCILILAPAWLTFCISAEG